MEKKQTALEWFAYNDAQATLDYAEGKSTELVFAVKKMAILQQALEMERRQIMDSWAHGVSAKNNTTSEEYYNEIYGKEKARP